MAHRCHGAAARAPSAAPPRAMGGQGQVQPLQGVTPSLPGGHQAPVTSRWPMAIVTSAVHDVIAHMVASWPALGATRGKGHQGHPHPQLGTPEPPQALPPSGRDTCDTVSVLGTSGWPSEKVGDISPHILESSVCRGWQREHPQLGTSVSPWTGCGCVPPNVGGLSVPGDGRGSTPKSGTSVSPSGHCQGHQASTRAPPCRHGPAGMGEPPAPF